MISPALSSLYNNASPNTLPQTNQTAADYKTQFLKLLLTQLQNQDPTKPVDSTTMVAQQAQIAGLEQMQNLNTNFVTMMAMQSVSQATNLIGKNVSGTVAGVATTGIVTGIKFASGSAVLQVKLADLSTVSMNLSDISQVNL